MGYSTHIFCAEDNPSLARELIENYAFSLAQAGIQHVMTLNIPSNSPKTTFVTVRTDDGRHVGAIGVYVCSSEGGEVENAFCALDQQVATRFHRSAGEGLALLCLGWVDPAHRNAGLYTRIIRLAVAILPFLRVRYVTAIGSKEGLLHYRKFGMVPDKTAGRGGEIAYPLGGFVSLVGWGDVEKAKKSLAREQQIIQQIRKSLCFAAAHLVRA